MKLLIVLLGMIISQPVALRVYTADPRLRTNQLRGAKNVQLPPDYSACMDRNILYVAKGILPYPDDLACVDGNLLFAVETDETMPKDAVRLSQTAKKWLELGKMICSRWTL